MTDRNAPIADGDTYCAPFCGCGCKRTAYERACAGAEELAKTLGADWRPSVWENMGWHYAAKCDAGAAVYPTVRGSTISGTYAITGYHALLSATGRSGYGDTPVEAYTDLLATLKAKVETLTNIIASLPERA